MAAYVPPHKRRQQQASTTATGSSSASTTERWKPRRQQQQRQPLRQGGDVRSDFYRRQREERQAPRQINSRWAASKPPETDCFGTHCQCGSGQSSVYRANKNSDHTIHNDTKIKTAVRVDGQTKGEQNTPISLLGHHGQFCGAFYHTAVSTEANNPFLCVGEGCIKAPTCVLVVRLVQEGGQETFVARYTNCYRGYEDSVHAEQFMMTDPVLKSLLEKDSMPKQLTMFITQQPCHHSSGRVETKHVSANTPCTNRLLEWSRGFLQERNVNLTIKLSRIFRAHWEDEDVHETAEDAEVFGSRAKMAKEGLRLLMKEPNIDVTMIDQMEDWLFLLSMSDSYVQHGGGKVGTEVEQEPKVTPGMLRARLEGDMWFNQFLIQLKRKEL